MAYLTSKKHNSWKDNGIVNCYLLTRNLASLWYGIDGLTHWFMSFPRFSTDAFKLPVLHVSQTYCTKSVYYISFYNIVRLLNSANSPYNFKHLKNGGSIQNDNTDSNCEIFYRTTSASKPVNQTYEAYQAFPHPHTPVKNLKCDQTHIK